MSLRGGRGGREADDGDHGLCGVYFAIVTQNDDSEGSARVKVRYPWIDGGDADQSFWAPISVPMCGDQFGTYTLPEIDDSVLVVFIAGDIRYPVVIGGAWSSADPPPETNSDGKNDFRLIKSRSGHRLLLDDSDSAKLVLTDKSDTNMLSCGNHGSGGSSDSNTYGVGAPPDVSGDGGKGVSVASLEGTLNIKCTSGTFEVTGKTADVIATENLDVKASGDIKIKSAKAGLGGAFGTKLKAPSVKVN